MSEYSSGALSGMIAGALFSGIIAGTACYIWGDNDGRAEERANRAAPSSYPRGSCSEQMAACKLVGGRVDFHQYRLSFEDDMPTCEKTVTVKP